jgi:hypothetical protein
MSASSISAISAGNSLNAAAPTTSRPALRYGNGENVLLDFTGVTIEYGRCSQMIEAMAWARLIEETLKFETPM